MWSPLLPLTTMGNSSAKVRPDEIVVTDVPSISLYTQYSFAFQIQVLVNADETLDTQAIVQRYIESDTLFKYLETRVYEASERYVYANMSQADYTNTTARYGHTIMKRLSVQILPNEDGGYNGLIYWKMRYIPLHLINECIQFHLENNIMEYDVIEETKQWVTVIIPGEVQMDRSQKN